MKKLVSNSSLYHEQCKLLYLYSRYCCKWPRAVEIWMRTPSRGGPRLGEWCRWTRKVSSLTVHIQFLKLIKNSCFFIPLISYLLGYIISPCANGHNFLQQVMNPSWVYWPMEVSRRNRGTPHTTAKRPYGTRKAPGEEQKPDTLACKDINIANNGLEDQTWKVITPSVLVAEVGERPYVT